MPKSNPSKQPKAAIKAKPRNKNAQPISEQAAASRSTAKRAPAIQSKPRPRSADQATATAKAKSKPATPSKPQVAGAHRAQIRVSPAVEPTPSGKLGILVQMLRRPQGASVYDLADAVGWNTNSIRGAMAGALKERGYIVTSEKPANTRIYRIAPPPKTSVRRRRG